MGNGRLRGATNGCRKGKCALIGRFSCQAPSVRRAGAAGVDRFIMECPGAGLGAGFRVREPAPGKDATFSGKPRNPDKCLHAHGCCVAPKSLISQSWQRPLPRCSKHRERDDQQPEHADRDDDLRCGVHRCLHQAIDAIQHLRSIALAPPPAPSDHAPGERKAKGSARSVRSIERAVDSPGDVVPHDPDLGKLAVIQLFECDAGPVSPPALDPAKQMLRETPSGEAAPGRSPPCATQ